MNLLAIETSTEFCSLAVCRDNVVSATHFPAAQRHGETVLEAVRALLAQAGLTLQDLDGIAFGHGPGSFTGLRIACGVTQGLALAFAIPVKGVSTLLALAEEVRYGSGGGRGHDKVIACLDARMGEVYHAACVRAADAPGWQVVAQPGLYQPEAVPVPDGAGWTACGTGFGIHGEALARRLGGDSRIIATLPGAVPTARAVLALARPQFEAGAGDDAALALPVYLRDKVALTRGERRAGQVLGAPSTHVPGAQAVAGESK